MQTNNQKAFSLIELIFVIIISGILAAVALPRFTGISDDAHVTKLQAFVGTLNRSVGPSMWSGLQRNEPDASASVIAAVANTKYSTIGTSDSVLGTDAQIEAIPLEFIGSAAGQLADVTAVLDLKANCMPAGNIVPAIGSPVGGFTAGKLVNTVVIGKITYALGCIDSSIASSVKFYLYDEVAGVIVY